MENASKALLIAGGIMIAIIIIAMFLSMYNRVSSLAKTQEEKKEAEQLQEFNVEYESYNKSIMYGVDVITLSNKINNNNNTNENDLTYSLSLYINNRKVEYINMIDKTGKIKYEDASTPVEISNFDKKLYKCQKIEYNDIGRVSEIYIVDK